MGRWRSVWGLVALCAACVAGPFGLEWEGAKAVPAADGSILVEDTSATGGAYIICKPIAVDAAQPWFLSVEARCEGVRSNGRVQVYVQCVDASGKTLKSLGTNSISGTTGWTRLSVRVKPGQWPNGTVAVRVILQPAAGPASGVGKAWFRNFEQGRPSGAQLNPAPWGLKWAGSKYDVADGCMKLADTSKAGGNYVVSNAMPIDTGKSFRFRVEARCEAVKVGRTQAYIFVNDASGRRIGQFATNVISGTADWTRLQVEVPASKWPKGTHHVQLMLQPAAGPGEATGTAWFRNLAHEALENARPIEGRECTGEFVFKYGNITLANQALHAFPFEHAPKQCRLEIMRKRPAHQSAIQILTDDMLGGSVQAALWLEGQEEYGALQTLPLKKVPRGYQVDVSGLAPWRKLALVFAGGGPLAFDDVQVSRVIFPEEDWQANWIWFTADRVEMIHVHLRKEFVLKSAPVRAMWQCAADDGAAVYFNGVRQPNVDGRFAPPNEDIARKLRAGKNVITVSVSQARYAAGFLGELDLFFADGTHQKLLTDRTWKYYPSEAEILRESHGGKAAELPPNWHTAEYDSSALRHCVELGVPPLGAWGAVKYRMNAPRESMTLLNEVCPDVLEAGREYRQKVAFRAKTPCQEPTPVRLQLNREGVTFLEWEVGIAPVGQQEFTLPFAFRLSPFIHPGDYELRMVISGYLATTADGKPCDARQVRVRNDRRAQMPDSKIRRDAHGVPTLVIDGKAWPSIFAARGGGQGRLTQHGAQFAKSGLHLYHIYLTPSWPTPETRSFARMDAIAEELLQGDPEAKAIVKIQLRDGKPAWYLGQYPDEAVQFENGAKANHVSLASRHWKKFAGEYIRELVGHVQQSPYADHIIGFIASEGEEGQWMHYWAGGDPAAPGTLSDYCPEMLKYFRHWLKEKYGNDAALQKAWCDPQVTLATAQIPTRQERCDGAMAFRILPKNRRAQDFGLALSDVVSQGIVYYAKIIKKASGGRALTGALYGHLMDLGGGFLGEQVGYARQKLPVETPFIDFYLGPISYSHRFRDVGYPGGYDMPSPGTLELHGKIWINEDDLRTHLEFPAGYAYSVRTPADTTQQLARETVKAICGRAGFYYFPLGDNGVAWFDDPETIDAIGGLTRVANATVAGDRSSVSEIALFFDDEGQCRLHQKLQQGEVSVNTAAIMQREALFRIGAPSDEYLQFDVANPKLRDYKFYVFLNPYFLKEDEIAAIRKLAARPGVKILFCFTPGIATDHGLDTAVAKQLTGMEFRIEEKPRQAEFHVARKAGSAFGQPKAMLGPVVVPSGFDEALATFADGTPAVVRKGNIYVAAMADLPVGLLREIAKSAGVYLYSEDDIAVYACRQYVGFHSARVEKPCAFRAPAGKRMRQIWPVDPAAKPVREVRWHNARPITRMYEVVE